MAIVLSLGGSLIVPKKINTEFLSKFVRLIKEKAKQERLIIVCGGGNTCRDYVEAAEDISEISKEDKDWIGIAATKLNAELLRACFGHLAYEKVTDNPAEKIETCKNIIIGSGYVPGSSSDKDAVILAKNFNAKKVINLTNTDYVYDKDPRKFDDAKPLKRISYKELLSITGESWIPGMHAPFDPVATKEAMEGKIEIIIVNGENLANLENCLNNGEFKGTIIS